MAQQHMKEIIIFLIEEIIQYFHTKFCLFIFLLIFAFSY